MIYKILIERNGYTELLNIKIDLDEESLEVIEQIKYDILDRLKESVSSIQKGSNDGNN